MLANEFSALVNNPKANASITNAVNIMNYFAQLDPQANRLLFILSAFRDVVIRQQNVRSQHLSANQTPQSFMDAPASGTDDGDPMGSLFTGNGPFSPTASAGPRKAEPANSRHNSDPKISPSAPYASLKRTSSHRNTPFQAAPNGDCRPTRNPSLGSIDAFLDLSRVNSYPNSLDGNDSLEIDFDAFWDTNGMGMTPGGLNAGPMLGFTQSGMGGMVDVQGVSDSSVPLFGMNSSEFGGF